MLNDGCPETAASQSVSIKRFKHSRNTKECSESPCLPEYHSCQASRLPLLVINIGYLHVIITVVSAKQVYYDKAFQ